MVSPIILHEKIGLTSLRFRMILSFIRCVNSQKPLVVQRLLDRTPKPFASTLTHPKVPISRANFPPKSLCCSGCHDWEGLCYCVSQGHHGHFNPPSSRQKSLPIEPAPKLTLQGCYHYIIYTCIYINTCVIVCLCVRVNKVMICQNMC
jgi:hypothetical protein